MRPELSFSSRADTQDGPASGTSPSLGARARPLLPAARQREEGARQWGWWVFPLLAALLQADLGLRGGYPVLAERPQGALCPRQLPGGEGTAASERAHPTLPGVYELRVH